MAEIIEATDGKTRDKRINDKLRHVLNAAADDAKIETVLVTSGGQAPKGSGGKRTGSTRHDNGNAADLELLKNGRPLDFTKAADRKIIEVFVTSAAARGATGIGAGVNYMGPNKLHVGFGAKSYWGAAGKRVNAPAWLEQAVLAGWQNPADNGTSAPSSDEPINVDEDEAEGDWRTFVGARLPLKDGDVRLVAGYLGCEVAALRAVTAVESRAAAFAADGRPIILNEPHIFWRELGAGANRNKAVKASLAYKKWGAMKYPKTQAARYNWLKKAMAIDETAALCSCSWGMGQVMGFNHGLCGFNTVQQFVAAMLKSEGAQLYAMARFIVSNRIQDELRAKDWSGFAKVYNGPGFAKGGYHTKLKNAYDSRPAAEKVIPHTVSEAEIRAALVDIDAAVVAEPPQPQPLAAQPGSGERMTVIARNGLRLRAGNSTDFDIVKALPFGTEVFVLEHEGDWAQVDLEGDGKADGFMLVSFLRPPGELPSPSTGTPTEEMPNESQLEELLSQLSDFIKRLRR